MNNIRSISAWVPSLLACVALLFFFCLTGRAQAANATGRWEITGKNTPLLAQTLVLKQKGSTVTGSMGNNIRIDGRVNERNSHQIDLNWSTNIASGWATLRFNSAWTGLEGLWGPPGRGPSGTFIGSRSLR